MVLTSPFRFEGNSVAGREDILEENLGDARIQFSADDVRDIDRAASQIEIHGARYPEHLQKMVGR